MKHIIILICLLLSTLNLSAKEELIIPRMANAPAIDGVVSDGEWDDGLKLEKFYQVIFEDNTEPTEKTIFYLGYDNENIYVLGKCYMRDQEDITVYHCERDAISKTDRILIFLDTFLTSDKAYCIGTNILGGKEDAILTNNGYDMSIDIPFFSKGSPTDYGYALEIALPLKNIKYKSGKNVRWGAYIRREILKNSKNNHEIVSPFPISTNASSRFDDYVIFVFEDLPTNRNLKLMPSIITSYSEDLDKITDVKDIKKKLSPEINIFYEPNSYITSTITVNPDFNIIEADALNIEVNNRYPTFYQEKRPFFIEQTNPFEVPINIYHTRNIVEPIWGAKIVGDVDKYAFYSLCAMDEDVPGDRFFEHYDGKNSNTLFCFSSLSRQLTKDGSMIRAAATLRKFKNYYNYVLNLDNTHRFLNNFTWQNQLVVSRNEIIDDKFKNGFAYYEKLAFDNKNWDMVFAAAGISPGFKADLGYVPETDIRSYSGDLEYSYFPNKKSIFWKVATETGGWIKYDYEHEDMIEWGIEPNIDFCFKNKIDINVNANKEKVLYGSSDEYYNTHFVIGSIIINTFNTIGGNIWLSAGKSLWYDWDDPAVENLLYYGSWLYYRPNRHIDVNFSFSYRELKTFYNAQLYEFRAKYQFNENFWLRGIFQVYDTEYEASEQKHRSINFYPLFAYQPKANISLYLGATGSEHEGEDKIGGTKFLDSRNVSYFFKISYAFDLM